MSTNLKNILVWLAVVVSLVLLWQLFYNIRDVSVEEKKFTAFYQEMTAKKIKEVKITGEDLEGVDSADKKFKTVIPPEASWDLVKQLQDNGVSVSIEKSSNSSIMYVFLSSWLPHLIKGFGTLESLTLRTRGGLILAAHKLFPGKIIHHP